ncbi:MAG: HD domain-containing phosphohydrolase [Huintestinicola sp.]
MDDQDYGIREVSMNEINEMILSTENAEPGDTAEPAEAAEAQDSESDSETEETSSAPAFSAAMIFSNDIVIPQDGVIDHLSFQLMRALSLASESSTPSYKGHARRTACYAREIVKRMGGDDAEQLKAYCAGLVHDIGNTAVPFNIPESHTTLTAEEYNLVKLHTSEGQRIMKGITELPEIIEAVKWHHERYDGKGYPDELIGEDIPYFARIIAVAEAYDAMTSERPYRSILSQHLVRDEMIRSSGSKYDPEIVKVMLSMINEDTNYELKQVVKNEWNILVVDDDPMILRMVEYILGRHKQYTLTTANSGKAALKILKENNDFDLIMLDVEMPLMDGVETLIKIRSDRLLSGIPIIFVTADNSRETLSKALKYGVSGYIIKPFVPHFLIRKINEVLNTRKLLDT